MTNDELFEEIVEKLENNELELGNWNAFVIDEEQYGFKIISSSIY